MLLNLHEIAVSQPEPHSRRPIFRRLSCLFLILLLPLFICGAVIVLYLVFPPPHIDLLVMGLDAREGEGAIARTDSILIVGIRPANFRVSVLSIPRDLFIDTPGYGMQRINTINVLGEVESPGEGPGLLAQSIAQNFGIDMERYIRLNFGAFVELVDAVGGISIDVERVIEDHAYPTADGEVTSIRFESGIQHMDGERALIYARVRHGSDDYDRARRQQQVLSALLARLANPGRWPALIEVLNKHLDSDLSLWDAALLAPSLVLSSGRVEQFVIDRDTIQNSGAGYNIPAYDRILPWLEDRFD